MKKDYNPDSDVNANKKNSDSNNNNASVSVNNYFDNNKTSDSSLDQQPIIQEGDTEEEEEQLEGDDIGSGEDDEDYSDYEEDIEEFASSDVAVHSHTATAYTTVAPHLTTEAIDSSLPQQEQLIQPDQIRNVMKEGDESVPSSSGIATATEIQDETSDWPRTEALIGIRPYEEEDEEDQVAEGSGGNGGSRRNNDDDDDDDYDDEETDIMKARKRVKNARENAERGGSRRFNNYNGNLEDESDEDGSSRYLKNRRFGKNNAIKFIETPHGKVGILYSSTNDDAKKSSSNQNGVQSSSGSSSSGGAGSQKPSTDVRKDLFRGISSDLRPILSSNPDSSREDRNSGSSSGGKMTPVLTADGKVALLYRGASAENENVAKKYEPIVNYTKPVTAPSPAQSQETNLDTDDEDEEGEREKVNVNVNLTPKEMNKDQFPVRSNNFDSDFNSRSNYEPQFPRENNHHNHHHHSPEKHNSVSGDVRDAGDRDRDQEDAMAPPPPPRLEDNNFLPILDRPLSELLGLKKHQFTHFRVTEPAPTTAIPHVNMRGKLPSNYDYDFGADYNGVSDQEILTKTEVVNLAIVPSITQERNSVVHHKGHANFRKHRPFRFEDLSNIHCAMQAVVGIAALACIFGMVGAYFKNRILDTQVPTYRL